MRSCVHACLQAAVGVCRLNMQSNKTFRNLLPHEFNQAVLVGCIESSLLPIALLSSSVLQQAKKMARDAHLEHSNHKHVFTRACKVEKALYSMLQCGEDLTCCLQPCSCGQGTTAQRPQLWAVLLHRLLAGRLPLSIGLLM